MDKETLVRLLRGIWQWELYESFSLLGLVQDRFDIFREKIIFA